MDGVPASLAERLQELTYDERAVAYLQVDDTTLNLVGCRRPSRELWASGRPPRRTGCRASLLPRGAFAARGVAVFRSLD